MELNVGILVPRSDTYPTLGMDLLNGFKLAVKPASGLKFNYTVEGTGNATDGSIVKLTEKLILQEAIDMIVAFCSDFHLEALVSLCEKYKKPLIHLDLGGRILKKLHVNDYVVHHTLNLWQSAFLSGKIGVKKFGKKVAVISSSYDGGYQFGESFVKGIEAAGGELVSFYVNPMDYKTVAYEKMIEQLEEVAPDFVFACFSYNEGKRIMQELAKSSLNGKVPVLAFPIMTDESINSDNYEIANVHSVASWAFEDDQPGMDEFRRKYKEAFEETPNVIALLAYEAGITLLKCAASEGKLPKKLGAEARNQTILSPRGEVYFNEYNEAVATEMKLLDFTYNKTAYKNSVNERIKTDGLEDLYEFYEEQPYTGWQNPYICT